MPSNEFLSPGTATTLTLLYDRPKEGESRFGTYRAYRVRTPDGGEHTFFPPRSLFPELDRLNLARGSRITVRTSERVSDDGRVFPRYEIAPETPGAPSISAGPTEPRASSGSSILASVALKAAASTGSAFSDPDQILTVADKYLSWLQDRSS